MYMPAEAPKTGIQTKGMYSYMLYSTHLPLVIGSQCPVEDQTATTYTTPPTESNFASLSMPSVTYLQQGPHIAARA